LRGFSTKAQLIFAIVDAAYQIRYVSLFIQKQYCIWVPKFTAGYVGEIEKSFETNATADAV